MLVLLYQNEQEKIVEVTVDACSGPQKGKLAIVLSIIKSFECGDAWERKESFGFDGAVTYTYSFKGENAAFDAAAKKLIADMKAYKSNDPKSQGKSLTDITQVIVAPPVMRAAPFAYATTHSDMKKDGGEPQQRSALSSASRASSSFAAASPSSSSNALSSSLFRHSSSTQPQRVPQLPHAAKYKEEPHPAKGCTLM